jgi:hypothetical protein
VVPGYQAPSINAGTTPEVITCLAVTLFMVAISPRSTAYSQPVRAASGVHRNVPRVFHLTRACAGINGLVQPKLKCCGSAEIAWLDDYATC